jgi:hypothetical protein
MSLLDRTAQAMRAALWCLLPCLTAACRENSPAVSLPARAQAPTHGEASPADPVQRESATASAAPPASVTTHFGSKAASAKQPLSGEDTIAVLVDSRFPRLTPDEAKQRLAEVGEVREERPVPNSLDVHADTSGPQFLVSYIRGAEGQWIFADSRATLITTDEQVAASTYKGYEQSLTKRFGKPAWVQEAQGPPPIVGWSVDSAMEVVLSQGKEEHGKLVVELEFIEPQGEAE